MSIGSVNVPGSIGAGIKSNPNLLDNWYFPDPINQREQSTYPQNSYTIDRWYTSALSGNSTGGIEFDINGIKLTPGDTLAQPLDSEPFLMNKKVTISALLSNGNLLTSSGIVRDGKFEKVIIDADNESKITISLYRWYGFYNNKLSFIIYIPMPEQTTSVHVVAAKLELGPVQTLAHKEGDTWVLNDPPPNKAVELAKCQRYQHILNIPNYRGLGPAQCYNGLWWYINVYTPVPLRATPTLSIDGPMAIINYDNTFHTASDFQLHSYFNNIAVIRFKAEGTTADDLGTSKHFDAWKGTGKILLDANL